GLHRRSCSRLAMRCSALTRPPPTLAAFPYTTLFRSLRGKLSADPAQLRCRRCRCPGPEPGAQRGGQRTRQSGAVPAPGRTGSQRDRKSTRLNSSHVKISYAAFCLKKKTDGEGSNAEH